ncbi:MAG: hypothetical protein BHW64_00825 [Candidatus Melainabacteria bacterium LEY3_CP_29_8]|nr:MAG: hypothetical protein BHW64_00825 [Candidatus Melainabacteria bacterium LEY3_CP_29_8]
MSKPVRKTILNSIAQFAIDKGCDYVDMSNPLSFCKLGLKKLEEHNRDRFIENVLAGIATVDTESLDAEKSLQRLYKSLQVISKATTQDKINRFKTLTINGILEQNSLTDSDYELFVRLTDTLTDLEFTYLYTFAKHISRELSANNTEDTKTQFNDATKRALQELKHLSITDGKLSFIRSSLAGYGLIKMAAAFGGLAFNGLSDIAYDYIEFIQNDKKTNLIE